VAMRAADPMPSLANRFNLVKAMVSLGKLEA